LPKIRTIFKQFRLYTVLIKVISIIFTDQMPTYLVLKKYVLSWNQNSIPSSLTVLKNDKAEYRAALRKCLNTYFFYPVDEFFKCKDDI